MEFTGVHKEDLVKLLKNLKNDHHLILGILFKSLIECRHKWICDSVQVAVPLSSWDCLSSFLDWACWKESHLLLYFKWDLLQKQRSSKNQLLIDLLLVHWFRGCIRWSSLKLGIILHLVRVNRFDILLKICWRLLPTW